MSTATLKTLSEKLGETTEVPLAEKSLNEAMQRWNSSVSRVVGMKKVDNTMNTHALNKEIMKNAMESEAGVVVEEKENTTKATPGKGKKSPGLVSKEEYSKLRANLRTKASLDDVNDLFRIIVANCQPKHGAGIALSAPELMSKGAKIKHAGDPKLEILRAVKRIKVTRDGIALAAGAKGGQGRSFRR